MQFICKVCDEPFVVKSLKLAEKIADGFTGPVCDMCRRTNKLTASVKNLNKGTQLEIMAFNHRLSKCEEKFSNIDVIIDTIIQEKVIEAETRNSKFLQYLSDENQQLSEKIRKLQNHIVTLNTKLIRMEESK
ncbi:MAG: hypothetical protein CM15mV62_810 [uncultured marine virus]|nr:MAG: hypothetical protein CM15mV62_810 [uncultured marine virus]